MKKHQKRQSIPYKTVFVSLFLFVIAVLMVSCEAQSLVGNWRGDGADTVYHSLPVTTAEVTTATTTAPPVTTSVATTTVPTTTAPPVTTAPLPPPTPYYNPLTGLPCSASEAAARPLAFCVKEATGGVIGRADLVIEAPTEASATRLALLKAGGAALWGEVTVASTRPYLAALSHDFFAISVYRGTSDLDRESASFLYNTVDVSETPVKEKDPEALMAAIKAASYQTTVAGSILLPYTLSDIGAGVPPQEGSSTYVSVAFSQGATTSFTYDTLAGCYTMRSSSALSSAEGGLPTFTNLVILFHDATRRISKDGVELTLDTNLGGTGYYVASGGHQRILWRRDPVTSRLYITDTDGVPLVLARGKTYVGMTTFEYREALILN
ncbi:MAG: DUF3048 C-terminal domain-containing protein [Clostridia bacterium]|nr:DUF3048 C-terminal domain-containing protein [Clostridia bacterium]